jgi:hypothetical protein
MAETAILSSHPLCPCYPPLPSPPAQVSDPNKALPASSPWSEHLQGNQLVAVWALTWRGFLNAFRNPAVIWLRFAM